MSEKNFKIRLRKEFEKFCEKDDAKFDWQLHEDGLSVGIPDISASMYHKGRGGLPFWIEAKYSNRLFKPANKYDEKFEKNQEAWLIRREMSGTPCFLFHEFSNGTLVVRSLGLAITMAGERNNQDFLDTGEARFFEGGFSGYDNLLDFYRCLYYNHSL